MNVQSGAEVADKQLKARTNASDKFNGLEIGRGFAAVFVLVSHAATIIAEPRFYNAALWDGRLAKLGAGVDFFFVLSGFIIAWAHWSDIGRPARLRTYAWRRFRRIYPIYWTVLFPLTLAYLFAPGAGKPSQHNGWNILFSIVLLPYPEPPILGAAWTLVYEINFYLLFAIVIWRGRLAFALLGLWGVAMVVASVTVAPLSYPSSILLDTLNLEFLLGIASAWWLRRWSIPVPQVLALLGFGSFLAIMLMDYPVAANPLMMRLGYGVSAAVGILGMVEMERRGRLLTPGPLRTLGAGSYAIYLIHGVAISAGIHGLIRVAPRTLPPEVGILVLTSIGVVAGLTFHFLVEKPLTRWLGGVPREPLAPNALRRGGAEHG